MADSDANPSSELSPEVRARILDHLRRAIAAEEEGHAFYVGAAAHTENALAKQVLESLAEDERHHVEIVKQRFQSLERGEPFGDVDVLAEELHAEEREMASLGRALRRRARFLPPNPTALQIYRAAIEFEKDGVHLYQDLAAEAAHPMERRFFELLHEMEQDHLEILDNTLHYLEDPEHYLSMHERWLVEG